MKLNEKNVFVIDYNTEIMLSKLPENKVLKISGRNYDVFSRIEKLVTVLQQIALKETNELKSIDLSDNEIVHNAINKLLEFLRNHTKYAENVEYLNLAKNKLNWIVVKNLEEVFQNNKVLEYVNLSSNDMDCKVGEWICKLLKGKAIKILDLSDNPLMSEHKDKLLEGLKNQLSCHKAYNENDEKNIAARDDKLLMGAKKKDINRYELFDSLRYNNFLQSLNLSNIGINDKVILSLLKVIENGLVRLDLSKNEISNEGIKPLIAAINNNKTLTHLNLSHNKLDGKDSEWLTFLVKNSVLEELNLSHNEISAGVAHLALPENSPLKKLDLSWNRIHKPGLVVLLKSLIDSSLIELNLSQNIYGAFNEASQILDALVTLINKSETLSILHLARTLLFNGQNLKFQKFTEAVGNSKILASVDLSHSSGFSETMFGYLISMIKKNDSLIKLDLSKNLIENHFGQIFINEIFLKPDNRMFPVKINIKDGNNNHNEIAEMLYADTRITKKQSSLLAEYNKVVEIQPYHLHVFLKEIAGELMGQQPHIAWDLYFDDL